MNDLSNRLVVGCVIIITGIAITAALIYTRAIMVPFVVSVFLYSALSSVISWFQNRLKVRKIYAAIFTGALVLLCSSLIIYYITTSFQNFFLGADIYKSRLSDFIRWLGEVSTNWNIEFNEKSVQKMIDDIPVFSMVRGVGGNIIVFVGNTLLVTVFVLFMVAGEGIEKARNRLVIEIKQRVSRYVSKKFMVSIATGLFVGVVLWVGNVELAIMFAVLTILLNFIPNIGSIISTLLPVPVLLLKFGFAWQTWVILGLISTVQFVIGNLVEPKILGESMDLHPVTVLMSLMFWALVWGVAGLFLAVPILSLIHISEPTRPY